MSGCEDGHGHDHGHDDAREAGHPCHDHGGHARAVRAGGGRRLGIALAVTLAFMLVEAVGGVLSNSRALIADAGHMLSDAAALALSLLACRFATARATNRKSYGWLRLEILAALANGVALVAIGALVLWESVERLLAPEPVEVPLMLGVAVFGLAANLVSALVLRGHDHGHLNVQSAYAHVLSDLLGSLGAIAAGLVMWRTGWWLADPIVALAVGALILRSAWRIIALAADILLEGVPAHIELEALEAALASAEGVKSIHDLHVWTISSGVHLLTVHAVVGDHGDHHEVLERLSTLVRERFGIHHSTIQLECDDLSAAEAAGTSFCERGAP
jgi:cobalt-zinc-cadmium efflux system protein